MVVQAGKHKCYGGMSGPKSPRAAADSSRLPDLPSDLDAWRLRQECAQTSRLLSTPLVSAAASVNDYYPVRKGPMSHAERLRITTG